MHLYFEIACNRSFFILVIFCYQNVWIGVFCILESITWNWEYLSHFIWACFGWYIYNCLLWLFSFINKCLLLWGCYKTEYRGYNRGYAWITCHRFLYFEIKMFISHKFLLKIVSLDYLLELYWSIVLEVFCFVLFVLNLNWSGASHRSLLSW